MFWISNFLKLFYIDQYRHVIEINIKPKCLVSVNNCITVTDRPRIWSKEIKWLFYLLYFDLLWNINKMFLILSTVQWVSNLEVFCWWSAWPSDQALVKNPSNFSLWVLVGSPSTNTGIGLYNIGLRKKKLKSAWKFIFEQNIYCCLNFKIQYHQFSEIRHFFKNLHVPYVEGKKYFFLDFFSHWHPNI